MSGDHGYDPYGFGETNMGMENFVADLQELQEDNAFLRNALEKQQETIRELRLELLIVLGYMDTGVPWWYGTALKDRIRNVLAKGDAE